MPVLGNPHMVNQMVKHGEDERMLKDGEQYGENNGETTRTLWCFPKSTEGLTSEE